MLRHAQPVALMTSSHSVAAPYAPLHAYLKGRYADTVVLTFAEMEDLLGFALPDAARVHEAWWSNDGGDHPSAPFLTWVKAGRRATPNLFARTVTFERVSS